MKKLYILLGVAGVLLLGWLVESLVHRDERRVAACVREAAEAVERGDGAALEALCLPSFAFDSPVSWVGGGDIPAMRRRLEEFWSRTALRTILIRGTEVQIEGDSARASLQGNLKFQIQEVGSFAIYKLRTVLDLREEAPGWRIVRAELLELAPGLF